MNCPVCGHNNETSTAYCVNCGADLNKPVQSTSQNNAPAETKANSGLDIAALVCGILSIFLFPIIFGTLGIILGAVSKNKGSKSGMATAGIVCGIIGIVGWILMLVLGGAALAFLAG